MKLQIGRSVLFRGKTPLAMEINPTADTKEKMGCEGMKGETFERLPSLSPPSSGMNPKQKKMRERVRKKARPRTKVALALAGKKSRLI